MKKLATILTLCIVLCTALCGLTACDSLPSAHTHVYNKKVISEEYIATDATCTQKAKYYYSCECGAKDLFTFEAGDVLEHSFTNYVYNDDATCTEDGTETATCDRVGCYEQHTQIALNTKLDHSYGAWVNNGDETHTKTCANDSSHQITEWCSGGTATETERAICSKCNTEYGSKLNHTHKFTQQEIAEKFLFSLATCTEKAEYYYSCACGEKGSETFEYGSALDHSYGDFVSNGDGTHTKTCANDSTHTITDNCSGGTATETERAICIECKQEYGELLEKQATEGVVFKLINNDTEYEVSRYTGTDTEVYIPSLYYGKSVTSIGYKAFEDCSSLTSIEIPDSVSFIGLGAFKKCRSLTGIEIPTIVTSINQEAFYGCSSLETIEIPDSVTSIGDSAFTYCSSLKSIEIPDSVTLIHGDAFSYCSSLSSVTIGSNASCFPYYPPFRWCTSLSSIFVSNENTKLYVENNCLINIYADSRYLVTAYATPTIPNNITVIEQEALSNCTSITELIIPNSVTYISKGALAGLLWLEKLTIPFVGSKKATNNSDTQYTLGYMFDDVWTSDDYYRLRQDFLENGEYVYSYYYLPKTLSSVTVTGGHIPHGAFENCSSLTSITIGDNVTSIGQRAFDMCTSITSIEISNSVTSIGYRAFVGCAITSIEIPNSVTSIGEDAFRACSSLISVTIGNSVTSIGEGAFDYCSSLEYIYCEAESRPSGWNINWKGYYCNAQVVWGYDGE